MSSAHRRPIPQMDEFREQLRVMAERELSATTQESVPKSRSSKRHPRPSKRLALALAACLVLVAAAAEATQLISIGKPVHSPSLPSRYHPGSTTPLLSVVSSDKAVGRSWGVQIYDSRDGQQCALAGQVRGVDLGIVEEGLFRPYENNRAGTCRKLSAGRVVFNFLSVKTDPPRFLVFGRIAAPGRTARLQYGRRTSRAHVGAGGAFLFVLGTKPSGAMHVAGLNAAGQIIDQ